MMSLAPIMRIALTPSIRDIMHRERQCANHAMHHLPGRRWSHAADLPILRLRRRRTPSKATSRRRFLHSCCLLVGQHQVLDIHLRRGARCLRRRLLDCLSRRRRRLARRHPSCRESSLARLRGPLPRILACKVWLSSPAEKPRLQASRAGWGAKAEMATDIAECD